MEELLNQLKFRLQVEDKNGVIWYDVFILLVFIAKYFPKLSGNKNLEAHVEWYSYDIARLTLTDWSAEEWESNAIETIIELDGFHDIPYGNGEADGMSSEIEFEAHIDKILSFNIPGLREFLIEYIPMTQMIYYDYVDFSVNGDERIYATDLNMLTLLTGETSYECELIL